MGDLLTAIVACAYVVIGCVYAWEGNAAKATYFIAAAILTGAVAKM